MINLCLVCVSDVFRLALAGLAGFWFVSCLCLVCVSGIFQLSLARLAGSCFLPRVCFFVFNLCRRVLKCGHVLASFVSRMCLVCSVDGVFDIFLWALDGLAQSWFAYRMGTLWVLMGQRDAAQVSHQESG